MRKLILVVLLLGLWLTPFTIFARTSHLTKPSDRPAALAPARWAAVVPFRPLGPQVGRKSAFTLHHERNITHRLTPAGRWLSLGAGLALAQPAQEAQKKPQGTWTATKAERDGKAAADVVGHQLSFTGNRFRLRSKDGKTLYAGTFGVDPGAKPASIDFEHTEGDLKLTRRTGLYR